MSSPIYQLQLGQRRLSFEVPRVMGVVNCTPDSFFAGSRAKSAEEAVAHGIHMLEAGADILDIGGQSSRPGATEIGPDEEWKRIEGAIKGILDRRPEALLSVDTFHHEVAARALAEGAFMINDIYAGLRDSQMMQVMQASGAPYAIMHMQGTPLTMQDHPAYHNITLEVLEWFKLRLSALTESGINQVMLDVGFGFGKTLQHNFQLLNDLEDFAQLQAPLLVGVSRKSMVYKSLGITPENALNGTTALHAWALDRGAHMIRVHDVLEAREVLLLHQALNERPFGN